MNTNHREDHLIRYMSDRKSLTDSELEMLENGNLKEEAGNLQSDLERMSITAANFAPEPLNDIIVPVKETFVFPFLRPVLSCGIAVLFLILIYHFSIPVGNSTIDLESVYQEIATDEIFMTEIDTLVGESAYSDFYPETSTIESKYNFSDEFIDVIVPI